MNSYGPTEATVYATAIEYEGASSLPTTEVPIGRPIANCRIYLLDEFGQPVPIGLTGEIYIGGAGVARGYLNRPGLTAERFLASPFVQGDRLYKTGDLARYQSDGNIEFLGRNDCQVKIRGYRIELGEIEAQLAGCSGVEEAAVLALEDTSGTQQLVAYLKARAGIELSASQLRSHLSALLPEYMLPSAYVTLDSFPLTPNGKLNRKGLPPPDASPVLTEQYAAPVGDIETTLAQVWSVLLKVRRIGRHDNFFSLGGHSLLAVTLIERMRQHNLHTDVRSLFTAQTLAQLALTVRRRNDDVTVPPNQIAADVTSITPQMLPLVTLNTAQIERIVATVPGGASNVQDIYPLAPLQEGILFHHLMNDRGDTYLMPLLLSFDTRERLNRYLSALQSVVARHDILRTAFVWQGLSEPVQVVWRRAPFSVQELTLGRAADIAGELRRRFDPSRYRLDLRRAPLMQMIVAQDIANDRWLLVQLDHHILSDHTTLEILLQEVQAHLLDTQAKLPPPIPFRDFVAQTRLGAAGAMERKAFFTRMLRNVVEPTAPYGLLDVLEDSSGISEIRVALESALAARIRQHARAANVSVASLFHLAYAQVLARLSGQTQVVFGTLLLGRMQGSRGADRALGMFINTLPISIPVVGWSVAACLRETHSLLAELLMHEHAGLAFVQRCSVIPAPTPLFSALLNYRHSTMELDEQARQAWQGIAVLSVHDRTNYPFVVSVDDLGDGFRFTVQVRDSIAPQRVCDYLKTALTHLLDALEHAPHTPMRQIEVLPPFEHSQLTVEWNNRSVEYPQHKCIHTLFEEQVARTPHAVAVTYDGKQMTYRRINEQANRLAHRLRKLGAVPNARVVICIERSLHTLVGMLAVLKAGGAFVPLDPRYSLERLSHLLADSQPRMVLTNPTTRAKLDEALIAAALDVTVLDVESGDDSSVLQSANNPSPFECGLTSTHLAYVIYTSDSTDAPVGVMVEHRAMVNLVTWHACEFPQARGTPTLQFSAPTSEMYLQEVFTTLCSGGRVVLVSDDARLNATMLLSVLKAEHVANIFLPASTLQSLVVRASEFALPDLRCVIATGDCLKSTPVLRSALMHWSNSRVLNYYSLPETHVAAAYILPQEPACWPASPPIGRSIANARIYILDELLQPAPVGVAGEMYVGGAGLARGYLNRPELTAERFIANPWVAGDRLYKTGDLARYLPDGNIEFLGHDDLRLNTGGFQIARREIETRLVNHPGVLDAVVVSPELNSGRTPLVEYHTVAPGAVVDPRHLLSDLAKVLPQFLVPAAFVMLDHLPLTPDGRVDRRALPVPMELSEVVKYAAPQTVTEEVLARIWAQVLNVAQVGLYDNFFELGGHSLLALKVAALVHERLGAELPLRTLFELPTLRELARELDHVARKSDVASC